MPRNTVVEVPRFDRHAFDRMCSDHGFTYEALSELLHHTRFTVGRWVSGRAVPSAQDLRAAAAVFNVPPVALLRPVNGAPSLADLRMNLVLTLAEVADQLCMAEHRLRLWEDTGKLGTAEEQPLLLASLVGLRIDAVTRYVRSGRIPVDITSRLARALQVSQQDIQCAFDCTRMRCQPDGRRSAS